MMRMLLRFGFFSWILLWRHNIKPATQLLSDRQPVLCTAITAADADCVCPARVCGLQGLFRVAPSASKLKKLKASLDCGVVDVQEYSSDPHAIAGMRRPRKCAGPPFP